MLLILLELRGSLCYLREENLVDKIEFSLPYSTSVSWEL